MIPRERRAKVSDMKNLIVFCVVLLLLALNCLAAPLQLSGGSGRSILGSIDSNNNTNQTNSSNRGGSLGLGEAAPRLFIECHREADSKSGLR
jgi:hypothetical protein